MNIIIPKIHRSNRLKLKYNQTEDDYRKFHFILFSILVFAGGIALALSLIISKQIGIQRLMILAATGILFLGFTILIFRKKISNNFRFRVFIISLYMLAVYSMHYFSAWGSYIVIFVVFILFVGISFGTKKGFVSLILSVATLCFYQIAFFNEGKRLLTETGINFQLFMFSKVIILLTTGSIVLFLNDYYMRSSKKALRKIEKSKKKLEKLNESLIASNSEKEKLVEQLSNALKKSQESDKLKSAFLASVSHEIRTPLNSIIGFSNIIVEHDKDKDLQKYCSIIEEQSDLLLRLIDDVIDYSKIEIGTLKLFYDDVCLNTFLKNLYSIYKRKIPNNLNLILKQPADEIFVSSDINRLNQVLINFLNNSLKYTHFGEILFGAKKLNENEVEIFVQDTGIGIPEDKIGLICERFTKLDKFSQGAGLGLSICKSILEQMGSFLKVESEINKGTRISFVYKIIKKRNISYENTQIKDREMKDNTIMIVDDQLSNRIYLKAVVHGHFSTILEAQNGEEAINLYKQYRNSLACILMDIRMPVLDGMKATSIIKQDDSEVKIIALTALAFDEDRQEMLNHGFDAIVTKPFKKDELLTTIQNLRN